VQQARKIVGDSGLGHALATEMVEEICFWPTGDEHDFDDDNDLDEGEDTEDYFPRTNAWAKREDKGEGAEVVTACFGYSGSRYAVMFTDNGVRSSFDGKDYKTGKVEFFADDVAVLGLDITREREAFSQWRWVDVYVFQPGRWMKHLIEIAAHIEASRKRG